MPDLEKSPISAARLLDNFQRFQVDERLQGVGKELSHDNGITPDNYEHSLNKNEKKYVPTPYRSFYS
jgi:hypothetical protein